MQSTTTQQPTEGEGLTHAGTRYLIADRDLDRLGWALMVWEQREASLRAAQGAEVRHAA